MRKNSQRKGSYGFHFKKWAFIALWCLPLATFLVLFIYKININYPSYGHDFDYNFIRLLAGRRHFYIQGFSPFRYVPYFCGGMTIYGNPSTMYYSIFQLIALLVDPWITINIVTSLSIIIGYFGWMLFGRDVLRLSSAWRHVLSIFILSNGIFLVQAYSGHIWSTSYPLLGILYWLFYTPKRETARQLFLHTIFFTFAIAHIFYSAGWPLILYIFLGFLLGTPFYFIFPKSRRASIYQLCIRSFCFGLGAILISIGKIVSVISFMSNISRATSFEKMASHSNPLFYIAKSFWAIPQKKILLIEAAHGLHEKSFLMSPFTIIGILLFIVLILIMNKKAINWFRKVLIITYMLLIVYVFKELTQGYGYLITPLEDLPVFRDMRKLFRALIILTILISICSAWSFNHLFSIAKFKKYSSVAAYFVISISLLTLHIGYPKSTLSEIQTHGNLTGWREIVAKNPIPQPVEEIVAKESENFLEGKSGLNCYEPLFKNTGNRQIYLLHPGSIFDITDGKFNMINPACFQYPKENNCKPWDRISIEDKENLMNFASGKKVSWKISNTQFFADYISGLTFIFMSISLILFFFFRIMRQTRLSIKGL